MNTITANETIIGEAISAKAKAIYQYLAYRSNKEHKCFPALKTIAKECSMSVSTVQRGLRELLGEGFIRKKHNYRPNGSQTSNIYELIESIRERAEVVKENMQQRLRDMRRKMEQISENKKQVRIPIIAAANGNEIECQKRNTLLHKLARKFKLSKLTTPPSQIDHPITSIS